MPTDDFFNTLDAYKRSKAMPSKTPNRLHHLVTISKWADGNVDIDTWDHGEKVGTHSMSPPEAEVFVEMLKMLLDYANDDFTNKPGEEAAIHGLAYTINGVTGEAS